MRVAFVSQWFPPERGTEVASGIATGLAELGHDVDVLTAFPNYPSGDLYPGWRQRPYQRDRLSNRVTVHRSPVFTSHDARPFRRMATYLSHAGTAAAITANRILAPDVWLIYSSPATAAIPAQLARPGRRAPVCLLVQDLWPDSVTGSGMVTGVAARALDRALGAYARLSYRHASRIGVISPGMKELLVARGVPAQKIHWTPNWLPAEQVQREAQPLGDVAPRARRRFLYAGNLGALQALPELVRAFAQVPEAELVLMGDGVVADALRQACDAIENVHVQPAVDQSEVSTHLAQADVLVVSLRDTPLLRVTMPSKVQASLRAGKPILAHAAGDAAAVVTDNGAGFSAPPGDLAGTVASIRRLVNASPMALAKMAEASRKTYDSTFTHEVGVRRLEIMLTDALEDAPR